MTPLSARSPGVPRLFYLLAVLVGFCGLPLAFAMTSLMAGRVLQDFLPLIVGDGPGALLAGAALFAAPHALMGAVFGLAWPELGWRWGVWLTAVPLGLLSFVVPGAAYFLAAAGLTTLPACAGAHAAAWMQLRHARAGVPW